MMQVSRTGWSRRIWTNWRNWPQTSAALDLLKLAGLLAMTADHVDRFLYAGALGLQATVGRLAFPVFAFALAINASRWTDAAATSASMWRAVRRMLVCGAVAAPAFVVLGQRGVLPLNVMFSFAVYLLLWDAWQRARSSVAAEGGGPLQLVAISAALAVLGTAAGATVEYLWFGMALFACSLWFRRRPGWRSALGLLTALAALYPFERSLWPVLLWPLLLLLGTTAATSSARSAGRERAEPSPRPVWRRLCFYVYYVGHLWVLAVVKHWIG